MARNLFFCQINPNYAIHCSAFTINNGRANVRQRLRQAYSPPPRRDTFFPNASHWAELTRPFRALTAVSRQFRIPPWKGGRGMFISALWRVNTEVRPYMNCPFLYPVIQSEAMNLLPSPSEIPHGVRNDKEGRSEHFPCHPERQRWISFPLPRGIPHCARNDRGTCCRDTNHCVSTVRTAFICVHLWNLCSDTVYLVHNHYPIGLKARFISALSRKGGVSMPIPWLEGCKPDIIVSGQYSAISQQINMSTIMQWRRLIGKFV